jgi:hypothetical protein
MTRDDIKYRQGKRKDQYEESMKSMAIGCIGVFSIIILTILFNLING